MNKVVKSLQEAIKLCGLKDGMTISFHHNLRAGDTITTQVMDTIKSMGIKDIHFAPTSTLSGHDPVERFFRDGTITKCSSSGITFVIGNAIKDSNLKEPVDMRTHGGRPYALESGALKIDVAFIAASSADTNGNCNGIDGKNPFGAMGYSIVDAIYAKKVIVITDSLSKDPIYPISIDQTFVDYVVDVESIGDARGLETKTTKSVTNPVKLKIAAMAAKVIEHSGCLNEGVCFQMGAGGMSLAAAKYIEEIMLKNQIQARYAIGGATKILTSMLEKDLIKVIYDCQSFDNAAVESLKYNKRHIEISASMYANPISKGGCLVDDLDFAFLGAAEIDTEFNVNVTTDSNNRIIGGAGGHGDVAQGSKITVITAPAFRGRIPTIRDKVNTITTPGKYIDVLVTQKGIAINTLIKKNIELKERLKDAGLPVMDIHDLKIDTERFTGKPEKIKKGDRTLARVLWRDDSVIDEIKE